jgi:RHS repeat-associated protein
MPRAHIAHPIVRSAARPTARLALAAAACVALLGTAVVPAQAAEPPGGDSTTPVVGDFAIGDGLEAMIDEQDGSFGVTIPIGDLELRWDSRAAAAGDRFALGAGWGYQLGFVDTDGGIRLVPPTSAEVFEADATAPSGLRGYTLEDLKFRRVDPDALPVRTDAVLDRPSVAAFVVHEVGGTSTYYDQAGDPVARISLHGDRTDWRWSPAVPHRLERIVDPDGVVTDLDWVAEDDTLIVRPGANLPAEYDGSDRTWRLRFNGDHAISDLVDPVGGRASFEYEGAQLTRISSAVGAQTLVDWQRFDDGVPRVRRVSTANGAGEQLSSRTWDRFGAAVSSGWPLVDGAGGPGQGAEPSYQTSLSDGATLIRSSYSSRRLLRSRDVLAASAAGERPLQRHEFEYPPAVGTSVDVGASGSVLSRPIAVEITRSDASGASRAEAAKFAYDAFGRVIRRIDDDGVATETSYDDVVPVGRELPIGLTTRTTTTAPDGLQEELVSTLNDARSAVIASQTTSGGGADGQPPTVTARSEFTVEADGFVSERREFPSGDAAAAPTVTRWSTETNLAAYAVTTVESTGVGTDAEASMSETRSLLHGGVVATTDVFGHEGRTEYDVLGRPVSTTDVADNPTVTTYETWQSHGRNATTVTGADDVATTDVRDELGRLIRRTDNIDHGVATEGHVRVVETIDYDLPGTVTVTDAWGATASVSKDAFGREVRRVGPTGLAEVTEYDDVADQVTTGATSTGRLDDAEFRSTERKNRATRTARTSVARADGVVVPEASEMVDGFGRPSAGSDGFVRTTAKYDAHGRPIMTTVAPESAAAAAGAAATPAPALVAERRFDAFGNGVEKRLADGAGETSGGIREIDGVGRTRTETDLAGRTSVFEYSLDGLVTNVGRTDGQATVHEYDPTTRRLMHSVTTSPSGLSVETAYEYDASTGEVVAVFDPRDRAATEIATTFDAHGNPLTTTYPDGVQVRHEYDLHGRRTKTTDPARNVTEFAYDGAGVLVGVVQRDSEGAELARAGYEFDELDRMVRLTRGNGVVTELSYTSADEIATESTRVAGRMISDRSYTYDARGLLVERVDEIADEGGDVERTSTRYRYDERERLVESSVHDEENADAAISTTAYELSVAGDVTAETVTRPGDGDSDGDRRSGTRRFEYSPVGELTAITDDTGRVEQAYDAAGNLSRAADGTTYRYNAANRPVTETTPEGVVIETDYWADGTRRSVSATDPDGATRSTEFAWDGDQLIGETHRAGDRAATTAAYLIGAGRHARTVSGAGTAYYGADRHGNVTDLTDADGHVTERYAYADYGAEVERGAGGSAAGPACGASSVGDAARNAFRYAGEYTDPTCRQHLSVRSYDSGSMRFTSMDTAAVMNPYGYTDANPITRVDPTGNFFTADDANGTYFAIALSALGIITTVFALAFPVGTLSHLAITGLSVGLVGDALAFSTSTARAAMLDAMDAHTNTVLSQVDVVSGFAIVGVLAAAHNAWRRFDRWRMTRRAAPRTRAHLIGEGPAQPRYGHMGDGNPNAGQRRPSNTEQTWDDEYEGVRFSPQGSLDPSPQLSPSPSPRSGSFTSILPDGRQVSRSVRTTQTGGFGRTGRPADRPGFRDQAPAARVMENGNLPAKHAAPAQRAHPSSSSPAPQVRLGRPGRERQLRHVLDPVSTTSTRWPTTETK